MLRLIAAPRPGRDKTEHGSLLLEKKKSGAELHRLYPRDGRRDDVALRPISFTPPGEKEIGRRATSSLRPSRGFGFAAGYSPPESLPTRNGCWVGCGEPPTGSSVTAVSWKEASSPAPSMATGARPSGAGLKSPRLIRFPAAIAPSRE